MRSGTSSAHLPRAFRSNAAHLGPDRADNRKEQSKDTDHTSEDRCEHEDCGHGGAACRLRYPSGRFVLGLHRGDEEPLKMTPPPIMYTI